MSKQNASLSPEFKKQTGKAINAIAFFVLTYLLLLTLAVGLTILSMYGGLMLIINFPKLITIMLGIGLASLGVLVLIFLVKFIFKSHKVDRSHLYEITQQDEPELFRLIDEIVKEVGTHFPKKVYLSTDVNASVFYDSSFWSMILPIRKNLQIGLGLVNSVTKSELKAILSHEFGHFSQRTMKVGSYVYNVNQVIFNMLYDNDSYSKIIHGWANVTGYFSIFAILAVRIIEAIQWILKKLYAIVNKRYMGLSREMEFHADEIAAGVTGYLPLKTSLLRLSFADHAFNSVLGFYDGQVEKSIRSANIYKEQSFVMHFFASESKVPVVHNFPEITIEEVNKYNKSKLVIKDQWASHPSTEDRIKRLELLPEAHHIIDNTPASGFFSNMDKLAETLTNKIFEQVNYPGEVSSNTLDNFIVQFEANFKNNTFSPVYNGYYDNKSPVRFELTTAVEPGTVLSFKDLFSTEKVNTVYTAIALQNDMDTLTQIAGEHTDIKTFDYDGKKYKKEEADSLKQDIKQELDTMNEQLKENDRHIFLYFSGLEQRESSDHLLSKLYEQFFEYDSGFAAKYQACADLQQALQFVSYSLPFDQIEANFLEAEPKEDEFKEMIRSLLTTNIIQPEITEAAKKNFEAYLDKKLIYFAAEIYYEDNLKILFGAINDYAALLSKGHFLLKKQLLHYQEQLHQSSAAEKLVQAQSA